MRMGAASPARQRCAHGGHAEMCHRRFQFACGPRGRAVTAVCAFAIETCRRRLRLL